MKVISILFFLITLSGSAQKFIDFKHDDSLVMIALNQPLCDTIYTIMYNRIKEFEPNTTYRIFKGNKLHSKSWMSSDTLYSKYFYPSTKLKAISKYILSDGSYEWVHQSRYYENGQLNFSYNPNQIDTSKLIVHYPNGQIERTANYAISQYYDYHYEYYPNGKIQYEAKLGSFEKPFKKPNIHYEKWYRSDGQLVQQINYQNGVPVDTILPSIDSVNKNILFTENTDSYTITYIDHGLECTYNRCGLYSFSYKPLEKRKKRITIMYDGRIK